MKWYQHILFCAHMTLYDKASPLQLLRYAILPTVWIHCKIWTSTGYECIELQRLTILHSLHQLEGRKAVRKKNKMQIVASFVEVSLFKYIYSYPGIEKPSSWNANNNK
ncbi:hypothetical protein GQX74_013762 [Glossina fuscipes]|nr:hypothetical protein GQX74_013762 [Glossina fuscipes]